MELVKKEEILPETVLEQLSEIAERYSKFNVPKLGDVKDRDMVMEWCKEIKLLHKKVKAQESEFCAPVKSLLAKIKARFTQAIDALELAEEKSKLAMIAYDSEVRKLAEESARRQQEEEDRAAQSKRADLEEKALVEDLFGDAAKAKELAEAAQKVEAAKIGIVDVKHAGSKKIKKFRILDKRLVPDDYKIVNEAMIGAIVRSAKDIKDVNIPGIEAYEDTIIAVVK